MRVFNGWVKALFACSIEDILVSDPSGSLLRWDNHAEHVTTAGEDHDCFPIEHGVLGSFPVASAYSISDLVLDPI